MIRYKLLLLTLLFLLVLALPGCATKPTVFSDFDARHDFSKNDSFTWVQDPPMLRSGNYPVSALAEHRMTSAIKNELIIKGYRFVEDQEDADFSVVYTMGARNKIEVIQYPSGYYKHRYDWGWGEYYFPYFVHFPFDKKRQFNEDYRSYIEGEIALDMFNTKTKLPIWHTKASKRLSHKDLDSNAKNAENIAIQLLQHFPWRGCRAEVSKECQPFE